MQIAAIAATQVVGTLRPAGTYLFRVSGTWDGITAVNFQYSEDEGATYRDVSESDLLLLTADMADPVALVVAEGTQWRLELDTPGASTSLTLWYAYAGAG